MAPSSSLNPKIRRRRRHSSSFLKSGATASAFSAASHPKDTGAPPVLKSPRIRGGTIKLLIGVALCMPMFQKSIFTDSLIISMDDFDIELDEMELVAAAAGYHYYTSITKQPARSLSPKGSGFMTEVLNGDDDFCREMLRMDKHVFRKLSDTLRQRGMLRDTASVMIEEQLGIFLNIVGHNERNRVIQERFQHSGETISRHFNNVLKAIKSLSREFLQPPPLTTPVEILKSNRFYPYLEGYDNMDGFIAPYEGVRYHLHEYRGANLLPRNAKELFNHRHSSLSNAIRKSFHVLKERFPILKLAPQYAFHTQRDIVIAACVIHNHIRREEKNDWLFNSSIEVGMTDEESPGLDEQPDLQSPFPIHDQMASSRRDSIAAAMWNDFMNKWDEW
ncbi:hypothetical protein DH2020_021862 [Rehmannia glutinosa]|uniref:DUF8040 domain-containing protein n=1 Tax=Rehmannia glutinosa TaxID=99300 RepID=A0ABR0WC84_REHGL